ncbi:helix-turn-helix domain-containing protein [Microvirga vignae]|uniref:helix-turn-helix domain-containing protein n=1 Tax=Microvirga vignae TaxID=1225564 RepID=UPI0009FD0684|nr:helix-turn-helix domain-containing protein [Microvirga vignae]
MSVTLLNKWQLLQKILADPDLSVTGKLVAGVLLDCLNAGTLQCNPSYHTLAKSVGLTRRRAIEGVKALQSRGWLTVARTDHEASKGTKKGLPSNSFTFDWSRLGEPAPSVENDTRASAENDTSPSVGNDTPLVPETALALVSETTPKHGNLETGNRTKKENAGARRSAERSPLGWGRAAPNSRTDERTERRGKKSKSTPVEMVFVLEGTEAYAAWLRHEGKSENSVHVKEIGGKRGRYYPSEWPPAASYPEAAE